jgi:hypothetical protein
MPIETDFMIFISVACTISTIISFYYLMPWNNDNCCTAERTDDERDGDSILTPLMHHTCEATRDSSCPITTTNITSNRESPVASTTILNDPTISILKTTIEGNRGVETFRGGVDDFSGTMDESKGDVSPSTTLADSPGKSVLFTYDSVSETDEESSSWSTCSSSTVDNSNSKEARMKELLCYDSSALSATVEVATDIAMDSSTTIDSELEQEASSSSFVAINDLHNIVTKKLLRHDRCNPQVNSSQVCDSGTDAEMASSSSDNEVQLLENAYHIKLRLIRFSDEIEGQTLATLHILPWTEYEESKWIPRLERCRMEL